MSRIAYIFLMLCLAAQNIGCSQPEGDVDILVLTASDSLLVEVLIDLHSIDAELYSKAVSRLDDDAPVAFDFSDRGPRDSVLALHHLDESSFNQ